MQLLRCKPKLFVYACCVFGAGMSVLLVLLPGVWPRLWVEVLVFCFLVMAVELWPTTIPREQASVSPGFAVIYAVALLWGPGPAAWVAALGTLRMKDLRGRVPWPIVAFNRGQLALAGASAGFVYMFLGGEVGRLRLPGDIVPMLAAGLAYFLVNWSAVVGASSLDKGVAFWRTWASNYRWAMPNFLGLVPLGAAIAALYAEVGMVSVILAVAPLAVARQSFQRYLDVRQAYIHTISALTEALDAKDPYTRGHSDRVAEVAAAIGRRLGLAEDTIELLSYVGRLHDVGKIGVRDAILKKPGIFTAYEYAEMQTHVLVGSDIVDRISLLGEGTAWVRHHHERYDGTGFPSGLRGEEIPLGARIIAVADAFDALTSVRPYKQALRTQDALTEMHRCAGTQFDPQLVQILEEIVDDSQTGRRQTGVLKVNELVAAGQDGVRKG
ncbi:MAG TPA: HD-GYP domain-containing protein [Firmicutes bacterium]|nr:HD-GYP domain-containing protein [Bacillota bacterium]